MHTGFVRARGQLTSDSASSLLTHRVLTGVVHVCPRGPSLGGEPACTKLATMPAIDTTCTTLQSFSQDRPSFIMLATVGITSYFKEDIDFRAEPWAESEEARTQTEDTPEPPPS